MSDLIRREDAINAIKWYCRDCNNYNGVRCRACNFDDAMNAVDVTPEVDVVEVSHAYWTYDGIEFKCSACGEWQEVRSNYCPECGAKMDMEDVENDKV